MIIPSRGAAALWVQLPVGGVVSVKACKSSKTLVSFYSSDARRAKPAFTSLLGLIHRVHSLRCQCQGACTGYGCPV